MTVIIAFTFSVFASFFRGPLQGEHKTLYADKSCITSFMTIGASSESDEGKQVREIEKEDIEYSFKIIDIIKDFFK